MINCSIHGEQKEFVVEDRTFCVICVQDLLARTSGKISSVAIVKKEAPVVEEAKSYTEIGGVRYEADESE